MSKTLGLDLGVTSIGWAVIEEKENEKIILGLGSRIIPLSTDDKDEFSSGNKISKNQKRTTKRTQRKGYDRYQQRREKLKKILRENEMFPDEKLFNLDAVSLFGLRDKALKEKISLKEIGRILYHLNQKRGYKSSRTDTNLDKKDTEYVTEVKNRHQKIKENGFTIGQYFYNNISLHQQYRLKEQIFPREAHLEEFDAIIDKQKEYYPELTQQLIKLLRDETIYFQRKLKSQKGLVSVCEFQGFYTKDKSGKEIFAGPKVTPRSSPLFQVCKIWETVNTITLKNKRGEWYDIPLEKKQQLFDYLDTHEKLSQTELFKILELKKEDGWYGNKQLAKGLQGNLTKTTLLAKLKEIDKENTLIQFNLDVQSNMTLIDSETGEAKELKIISSGFEKEPLYKLWHTIYSITDLDECTAAIQKKFRLPFNIASTLANIDFTKAGFGNKSAKAIRKILPYLMQGYVYSDACSFAGYNHSNSLTSDENIKRQLSDRLANLPKNSLRQPVVEKILNQMINVVNAIIERYGKPDEIRIELARELKQSKDERNETFANLTRRERENDTIRKRIETEYSHLGIRATRNNIIKWRLFHEISNEESKINGICIYCGQPFGITDALLGNLVDIEHIIPKSRLFDDSQSNKTLSHRKCNADKGDRTAYDFMKTKSNEVFQKYLETVNNLYHNGIIGKAKRDKLLMVGDKIPQDFIDRQLRETQYISRKAREILQQVCYNVWSTSGSVTEYLRRIWGWDDVLMNLQLPKYRQMGLTDWKEINTANGQVQKKEIIKDWSKRDDHRHHAIDALTIACTRQGYIQRINTLNASNTRDAMRREIEEATKEYDNRKNLLENYFFAERPFTTAQLEIEAAKILVSFKAGKKVATSGKRKIKVNGRKQVVQTGIIVPRGALSEESVYGKIKTTEKEKPVKYLFENSHLIFKPYIKSLVEERLASHDNNPKAALASLKKEPIYLDENKTIPLKYATCYKEEYVIKYPVESIKAKDLDSIIDKKVREIIKERLEQYGNKEKEAFKNLKENPVWYNAEKKIPIKTVRCFTGLSAVEPVKRNNEGKEIGFVKPGNNHHIAFYIDKNGKKQEHVCSFWHAVERKKYNIPVIIKDPKEVWDKVLENQIEYPQSFLDKLPEDNWQFDESLQQNEMFILGLQKDIDEKAIVENNKKLISEYLYLLWSVSENNYWFRHHLETKNSDLKKTHGAKESKRYYLCKSIGAYERLNPIKVKINNLGEIQRK
ncbi:MAG TPA: type II CRISPR RNA-guided endonuclease Cas9 [Chitinophagaceae bacterium]|nr:type II CRISPR RNA-guided endonuclease Cas9 [Chitinophagaceae bacterium]